MKLLLIVPAYNEEDNIVKTVQQILDYKKSFSSDVELDYIVINDGSKDSTESICKENGINCLSLVQNLGIGGAVQTGYMYAFMKGYDIAVQFDGDGQHDINSLNDLVKPIIDNKANFVVGSRFIKGDSNFKSTFLRRVGIKWLSFLIFIFTGKRILDVTSGFRAADKKIIKLFAENYPIDYPEPESIMFLLNNKIEIAEVQVNMFEREGGISSIHSWKTIYYMVKVSLSILCAKFQGKEND